MSTDLSWGIRTIDLIGHGAAFLRTLICRSELLGFANLVYAKVDHSKNWTPSKVVPELDELRGDEPFPKWAKEQAKARTNAAGKSCPQRGARKKASGLSPHKQSHLKLSVWFHDW